MFVSEFMTRVNPQLEGESSKKIEGLLTEVYNLGYTIDDQKIVFGVNGESWPLLKSRTIQIISGQAIGVNGSQGRGTNTLEQYLQTLIQTQTVAKPMLVVSGCSSLTQLEAPVAAAKKTNVSAQEAAKSIVSFFSSSNVSYTGPTSDDPDEFLEELRARDLFIGEKPTEKSNSFTAEQFFDAEIFVFEGGRCLIVKDKKILVKSDGLNVLNEFMPGLYEHRGNQFMDVPCADFLRLRTDLSNIEKIQMILPYLNSLPAYK